MSLFPRYIANEFAPMFRLMDDYAAHRTGSLNSNEWPSSFSSTFKSFTPKFDVKENKDSYELHGELPGIKQENVNIEFTDAQTLTIKGRTEHVREEGERAAGLVEGGEQQKQIEGNNGYHKPSVEEEGSKQASSDKNTEVQKSSSEEAKQSEKQSKYWVSERSVGEFARTFSFPTRVDQENVKASLKDGVLSIVVPKAQAPTSKKINIE
ncbi:hypothetical protein M409DRAFT_16527 [Zasmidium cellare ATCC 36951]|uniref:SHSP domain-containing protein n=1 Tax=Zasmidium cellare ATCC 36951 TaxID=1080233 RepID=A0A6A6D553_ZASCE|nr:uncharacterized protein M409DRAFT_16527 [Zasmidium cellare ATCC 36951]KAF2174263.1 hypothetical protein M409DRAFT_16527 [Zasmidium cellare ATCC 36951]